MRVQEPAGLGSHPAPRLTAHQLGQVPGKELTSLSFSFLSYKMGVIIPIVEGPQDN